MSRKSSRYVFIIARYNLPTGSLTADEPRIAAHSRQFREIAQNRSLARPAALLGHFSAGSQPRYLIWPICRFRLPGARLMPRRCHRVLKISHFANCEGGTHKVARLRFVCCDRAVDVDADFSAPACCGAIGARSRRQCCASTLSPISTRQPPPQQPSQNAAPAERPGRAADKVGR